MIGDFIDWVAGLPPLAIYAVVGILGFLENIFPPVPADSAIALGALLSLRGVTSLWTIFLVTIVLNLAGAMGMYWVAARNSAAMFDSRAVQRVLPSGGMEFVRREYQRFGLPGLFLARLLPGFRAIVPPFAGLIHIAPLPTALVIALASGVWYGGIIFLLGQIGAHWDEISHLVARVNLGLGIAALAVAAGLALWLRRRWRQHRPQ